MTANFAAKVLRICPANTAMLLIDHEISASDDADFVAAVKAKGENQLTIAGTITSVCLAFVVLPTPFLGVEQASSLPLSARLDVATNAPADRGHLEARTAARRPRGRPFRPGRQAPRG
jgi:hypothetical protein